MRITTRAAGVAGSAFLAAAIAAPGAHAGLVDGTLNNARAAGHADLLGVGIDSRVGPRDEDNASNVRLAVTGAAGSAEVNVSDPTPSASRKARRASRSTARVRTRR